MKYNVILADCAWTYDNPKSNNPKLGGKTYPCLSLEELKNIPVHKIMAKDCYLFLWEVMPKKKESMEVLEAWGFRYVTTPFCWVKLNPLGVGIYSGLGSYTNGNKEDVIMGAKEEEEFQDVLLGKVGKTLERLRKDVKQLIIEPRSRHSEKPQELKRRIETLLGDIPRIELFARERREDGWHYWGNELINNDIPLDWSKW